MASPTGRYVRIKEARGKERVYDAENGYVEVDARTLMPTSQKPAKLKTVSDKRIIDCARDLVKLADFHGIYTAVVNRDAKGNPEHPAYWRNARKVLADSGFPVTVEVKDGNVTFRRLK